MLRYYRTAIWVPVALPLLTWVVLHLADWPLREPFVAVTGALLVSGVYGGVPYALLASWATWRVGAMDEASIRRLALRAPFIMLLAFLPFGLILVGAGMESLRAALEFFGLAALYILVMGYAYVAATLLLRRAYVAYAKRRRVVPAV